MKRCKTGYSHYRHRLADAVLFVLQVPINFETGQVRLSTWFGWLSDLRGTMRQVIQCVKTMCAVYIAGIGRRILPEGPFLPGALDKSAME